MVWIRPYLKKGEKGKASAKESVERVLSTVGYDPTLYAVFEAWDKESRGLVPGCIAAGLEGSKLTVTVPSTVHRQELIYSKAQLIKRVNQALGRKIITDIRFELSSTQK